LRHSSFYQKTRRHLGLHNTPDAPVKLQKYFKLTDRLFSIEGEKHRPIIDNPLYIKELERFLLNNEL
jgi:hypothetical protein